MASEAATVTVTVTTARVPAWKRLGLKLKYANAEPEKTASPAVDPIGEVQSAVKQKEKRKKKSPDDRDDSHATGAATTGNKRRRLKSPTETSSKLDEGVQLHTNETPVKKSVSFTPDTKHEDDGEEVEIDFGESTQGQNGGEDYNNTKVKKKNKKRKEKRMKRQEATQSIEAPSTPSVHNTPIISYLARYYEDRSSWKFQKNRETHLLKHALSVDQVPSRFNTPLLVYLQGLKSEGAKQRLWEGAEAAVRIDEGAAEEKSDAKSHSDDSQVGAKPDENASFSGALKAKYGDAVCAFRTNLSAGEKDLEEGSIMKDAEVDIQKRLERRKRAELVLWAVGGTTSLSSSIGGRSTSSPVETALENGANPKNNSANAQKTKNKKKRKNRTAVVEISSSSESDSDSDN